MSEVLGRGSPLSGGGGRARGLFNGTICNSHRFSAKRGRQNCVRMRSWFIYPGFSKRVLACGVLQQERCWFVENTPRTHLTQPERSLFACCGIQRVLAVGDSILLNEQATCDHPHRVKNKTRYRGWCLRATVGLIVTLPRKTGQRVSPFFHRVDLDLDLPTVIFVFR